MEVKLDVSEEQLKELLSKEVKDLPKDMIQNILTECIKEYFSNNNSENLENIFIEKNYNHYNTIRREPSPFLKELLEKCDYSELQKIVDDCIKDLKENYRDIMIKVLASMMAESLAKSFNFQQSMYEAINDELNYRAYHQNNNINN